MLLGPTFADRDLERDYTLTTREHRRGGVQLLLTFAVIAMTLHVLGTALSLERVIAVPFALLGVWVVIACALARAYTKTDHYLSSPWADFVTFAIISPAMAAGAVYLGEAAKQTGWSTVPVLIGNSQILLSFTVLYFVASWRWYLLWVLVHLSGVSFLTIVVFRQSPGLAVGLPGLLTSVVAALFSNLMIDVASRRSFKTRLDLESEKAKSESLLYNVLPQAVADRLRRGEAVADAYSDVSVIFVDLVGSSNLARTLSPKHFVETLNGVFSLADNCAAEAGVEKVKTIGDAYLAVAGTRDEAGAPKALRFARELIERISLLAAERSLDLTIRVGIHNGPVIGGVIGETRMAYDYWGDTMNVAARVQSAAEPGRICVTEPTYFATRHLQAYGPPRLIVLKGIGEAKVYDARL